MNRKTLLVGVGIMALLMAVTAVYFLTNKNDTLRVEVVSSIHPGPPHKSS